MVELGNKPSLGEVLRVKEGHDKDRVVRVNKLPVETFHYGVNLNLKVWSDRDEPKDWRDATMISIYK